MARIDKLERARQEGMSYALEVAKKKGIEGLEEELRMRGITGIPIGVSRSAVDKAVENIKNQPCKQGKAYQKWKAWMQESGGAYETGE